MPIQTILIIRHAEKPDAAGDTAVDVTGAPDKHSLIPRGWQRAGAWAQLFCPSLGIASALPAPDRLFASAFVSKKAIAATDDGSKSKRPVETITPLAARLGFSINDDHTKGEEADLVAAIGGLPGVTLVCWQHESINAIAAALAPGVAVPAVWPGTVFNVIYRFDRASAGAAWTFSQLAPVLLDGDLGHGN